MTPRALVQRVLAGERLNFLLTNCVPRRTLTRFAGWFCAIEQPLVRDASIAAWKWFADVDLRDARKTRFASLRDAFTRELVPGARPANADPAVLASPCDAIVGACGPIEDGQAHQVKGSRYALAELLRDGALAAAYDGGRYATLRLTAGMYHRFHAPHDVTVERVTYIAGDAFNVNPPALRRVARLYCRNTRAVLRLRLNATGRLVTLVPVGAVLVASIRLHFLDVAGRAPPRASRDFACDAQFPKGAEMGWFEHGSTIVVVAPRGYAVCGGIATGARIRAGAALMRVAPESITR